MALLVVLVLAELPALEITGAERITMLIVGAIALSNGGAPVVAYFANHAGIVTGLVMWAVGGLTVVATVSHRVVHRVLVEAAGGLVVIGGAALTGVQHQGFATLFGLVTAVGMLALGSQPGRVLMSVTGSLCLLVNVPWAISHYFPSENLAPLLIAVSGVLLVAVAVLLTRMGGRFRTELRY